MFVLFSRKPSERFLFQTFDLAEAEESVGGRTVCQKTVVLRIRILIHGSTVDDLIDRNDQFVIGIDIRFEINGFRAYREADVIAAETDGEVTAGFV